MEFDREHEGRKYALLSPVFEQNATLKSDASAAGVTVTFDRAEHGFRLYEDVVPASVDADAVFGKYATAEAKAASAAERAEFDAKLGRTNVQTSAKYDEASLYYPPQKDKERDEFNRLRKETGVVFTYSPKAGAFVHHSGDTEAFARWQTPEMKAQWQLESKDRNKQQTTLIDKTANGVERLGKIADGRNFLADHEKGFMLPSKTRNPELHEHLSRMLTQTKESGVKVVSDEDLSQVFTNTKGALKALERKEYGIKITAAQEKTPDLTVDQFQKMNDKERAEAAGSASLRSDEYSKMVSLRYGFFALRKEMIARDLATTKEAAREIVSKGKAAESGQSPHAKEQKMSKAAEPEKQVAAEKVAPEKAKDKPAAAPKGPSKDGAKPARAGAMADALLNAGLGR